MTKKATRQPVRRTIPHSSPYLGRQEEKAAIRALRHRWLSEGPDNATLVRRMCGLLRVPAGIGTSSGTAALHLALLALNTGAGDEVVLPSYVCPSLLYAIRYCNATPVLVDCGDINYNITADSVRPALTRKTKALMVPHMFGLTADLSSLAELGIPIIEDCAHTIGAFYKGQPVGSIGKLSIFSFYATKMIGAAGGGFLASSDPGLIEKAKDLSSINGKRGSRLRFNYQLSNMQAAIASCQLKRLGGFVRRRKRIAAYYNRALRELQLSVPEYRSEFMDHVYYRYIIEIPTDADEFRRAMFKNGVHCGYGVLEPLHRSMGLTSKQFPNSDRAADHAVSIPIYPALEDEDVKKITSAIKCSLAERKSS